MSVHAADCAVDRAVLHLVVIFCEWGSRCSPNAPNINKLEASLKSYKRHQFIHVKPGRYSDILPDQCVETEREFVVLCPAMGAINKH